MNKELKKRLEKTNDRTEQNEVVQQAKLNKEKFNELKNEKIYQRSYTMNIYL